MPLRPSRGKTWSAALAGGVAGTAAMSATLAVHTRVLPGKDGLIDYDASDHVTIAASKVIGWRPRTTQQRKALFNLVHWGYGSAVAIEYDELRRLLGSDLRAAIAFFVACQSMAFALFPLLGETPPPWRWRRAVLLSSLGEHALYVATVVTVSRAVRHSVECNVSAASTTQN